MLFRFLFALPNAGDYVECGADWRQVLRALKAAETNWYPLPQLQQGAIATG
jgi:hypothetical protein